MTLHEAIGVNTQGCDTKTGEKLTFEEEMGRAIEYLGGLTAVARYIPFPLEVLRTAYKRDKHLNNTPLRVWDRAAGFDTRPKRIGTQISDCRLVYTGIVDLYAAHGITGFSCSDGVCILKEAARRLIEGGEHDAPEAL